MDRIGISIVGGVVVGVLVWALDFVPLPVWAGFVAAIVLFVWDALT